jgi:hypothetical protein
LGKNQQAADGDHYENHRQQPIFFILPEKQPELAQ